MGQEKETTGKTAQKIILGVIITTAFGGLFTIMGFYYRSSEQMPGVIQDIQQLKTDVKATSEICNPYRMQSIDKKLDLHEELFRQIISRMDDMKTETNEKFDKIKDLLIEIKRHQP